jgi:hypothetical protein
MIGLLVVIPLGIAVFRVIIMMETLVIKTIAEILMLQVKDGVATASATVVKDNLNQYLPH